MKVPDLFPQVTATRDVVIGLGAIGLAFIIMVLVMNNRADHAKAKTEVTTTSIASTVTHAQRQVTQEVAQKSEETHVRITNVEGRTKRAVARHREAVAQAPAGVPDVDTDRIWYIGMCESALYADAPECRSYRR